MFQYNTIEEALQALRNGEVILVTDDEDRENEGDLICAAGVCNDRKCKLYGIAGKRPYLYANEQSVYTKIRSASNGRTKYGQSRDCVYSFH